MKCFLQNGLKQNIQLIIAKAVIAIFEENQIGNHSMDDSGFVKAFCMGLDFGTHYKQSGWGQGYNNTYLYDEYHALSDREDKPHALALMVFVLLRKTVLICHLGLLFHPSRTLA